MAGINLLPARFPVAVTTGNDVTITLDVNDALGADYTWSGKTVVAPIVGHTTVTGFTVDTSTDGTLVLSLTDAQTTALGSDAGFEWSLSVTVGTATRTWLSGPLSVYRPGRPGATNTTTGTLTVAGAAGTAVTVSGLAVVATGVAFTPTGTVAATTVQAAIAEVSGDVTDHLADTADAHDASAVSVADAGGYYTGTNVETALAEVKVIADAAAVAASPLIVFDGDSLTSGVGSTTALNALESAGGLNYPAQASAGLQPDATIYNFGVGGQTVTAMNADAPAQIDTLYDPARPCIAVLLGGINDLYTADTAATVYARIVAWHTARRAAGFKTVAITILPATGNSPPGDIVAKTASVNSSIAANWATFADALCDAAASSVFTTGGVTTDPHYYSTDAVHLNNDGYEFLAGLVRPVLASLLVKQPHTHKTYARRQFFNTDVVGWGNTFAGTAKGAAMVDGVANVTAVGDLAGAGLTSATNVTAIGAGAAQLTTTGGNNTAVGTIALQLNTTESNSTAIGSQCLYAATGGNNTAVGAFAGRYLSTGTDNCILGHNAMYSSTASVGSVAIGKEALKDGTSVSNCVAIGEFALRSATASYNTSVGYSAGYAPAGVVANATTSGIHQTLVGCQSGQSLPGVCSELTAVGYNAIGGGYSTAVGASATASGDFAVALGQGAVASHANAIALGYLSTTTATYQVMIGPRDLEITDTAKGLVIKSPDGTRYRVQVANGGALSAVAA